MTITGVDAPAGSLLVLAAWRAGPGHVDAVVGLAKEIEAATREEPGCVFFNATQRLSDLDCFSVVECYRTPEDFAVHRATAHFHDIVASRLVPLLEDRVVQTYVVTKDGELQPRSI